MADQRDGGPTAASRGLTAWMVITVTILAAVLRLYHIGAASLWTDEAYSVWMASKPSLAEIWHWTRMLEEKPPLFYWVLHIWMKAGSSEGVVRLLSAVCGTLTVPVVFGIGDTIGGQDVGLMAAFLLAVSPVSVHYSQEARMYSLLPFAAAVSMFGLAWLLRSATHTQEEASRGAQRMAWFAYIGGTAVALWVHYPAVFLPLSANIVVLLTWSRLVHRAYFVRTWMLAQAMVIGLCLPLVPLYLHQSSGPNFPPIPPFQTRAVLEGISPDLIAFFRLPSWFQTARLVEIPIAITVAFVAVQTWKRKQPWLAFGLVLWLVPLIGEILTSILWRPILFPKVLIWTTIPFYVLVAAILTASRKRLVVRTAVLAGLLCVAAAGLAVDYWAQPEYEAWRPAAQYVAETMHPGDTILFNDNIVELPFDYYFGRYHVTAIEQGIPTDFWASAVGEPKMTPADIPTLRQLASRYHRLWLVYSHAWYTDPNHLIPDTLGRVARLISTQSFPSQEPIKIMQYERHGP